MVGMPIAFLRLDKEAGVRQDVCLKEQATHVRKGKGGTSRLFQSPGTELVLFQVSWPLGKLLDLLLDMASHKPKLTEAGYVCVFV
jgi:hypothetical protein